MGKTHGQVIERFLGRKEDDDPCSNAKVFRHSLESSTIIIQDKGDGADAREEITVGEPEAGQDTLQSILKWSHDQAVVPNLKAIVLIEFVESDGIEVYKAMVVEGQRRQVNDNSARLKQFDNIREDLRKVEDMLGGTYVNDYTSFAFVLLRKRSRQVLCYSGAPIDINIVVFPEADHF